MPLVLLASLACTQRSVPSEPPPTGPREGAPQMYEVQWGDTLFDISSRFGVPGGLYEVAETNDLYDVHWIQAGELLMLEGVAAPELPPWPSYTPVDGLEVCEASVGEVPSGPGLPPDFCPGGGMLLVEVQLDQDGERERLYGCPLEADDSGMSTWKVGIVDGPALVQTIELANFGETSVVEGERGCELLVSTWETAPLGMTQAWMLLGRRMRLQGGELRPASTELRARRLLYDYSPGAVADDLSSRQAKLRNVEPALQGELVSQSMGQLPAELPYDARIGDGATRLLYPPGYRPRSAGKVLIEQRRVNAWGNVRSIYWLQ